MKNALNKIFANLALPKAEQGLSLDVPLAGQLHFINSEVMPEAFVLITNVEGNQCDVIPGSFDALMGGPNDLILPAYVMGDYVSLSMDLATTLSMSSIGKGFAILDDDTYERVLDSLDVFNGEEAEGKRPFEYALPYIGVSDERIPYHSRLSQLMKELQSGELLRNFQRACIFTLWAQRGNALAAGSEKTNPQVEFKVMGKNVTIFIEYFRESKQLSLDVYDADGNASQVMDGCQLRSASGHEVVGIIQDGSLFMDYPANVPGEFKFTDAEGKDVPGEWRRTS